LVARASFATEAESADSPLLVPSFEAVAAAFPQLEILGLIGRGGMGDVYRFLGLHPTALFAFSTFHLG